MRLKCISGPSNGKRVELPDSYREIEITDPRVLPLACVGSKIAPTFSVGFTVYTRRVLRESINGSLQEVEYLAPDGVGDLEAIRHLFE